MKKPPRFHPSISDAVVQIELDDAEKKIVYYTKLRDDAKAELERREKAKQKK